MKDAHFVGIMIFLGFIFLGLGMTLILAKAVDHKLSGVNQDHQAASSMARLRRQPPEPRLQINEAVDMVRMRDVEQRVLQTYGWINPEAGIVHVPIERAMELSLQEGFPSR